MPEEAVEVLGEDQADHGVAACLGSGAALMRAAGHRTRLQRDDGGPSKEV
jgi:hypothetical protein